MKGGGNQQQPSDQISNFFWMVGLAVGVFLFCWWLKREWIVIPILGFRAYETYILQFIGEWWGKLATLLPWLHLPVFDNDNFVSIRDYIASTPVNLIKFENFAGINGYVGDMFRFPCMIILMSLAVIIYFRHTSNRYRKDYSMDDLRKQESKNWPQITPILSLDLLKEDIDVGPWAMAKTPLDFCKEHDMLVTGEGEDNKIVWKLKPEPAYRVFALQLGATWRGPKHLPIHLKALLVIFLGRALRQRDIANRFLKQISASAAHGKLDFNGVEEQLEKYFDAKPLKWLEGRHAYVGTLMASLLEISRIDGVLASSEFLWLKPVDRRMWYMLNCVGRQTAVVEIAGLFAHWQAEKRMKRPLKNPLVKEAVAGLEDEIQKILYIPETEKWQ